MSLAEEKTGWGEPPPPDPPSPIRTSSGAARPTQSSVSLTRLRIAGFKSFAEPTSLEILSGLTGIVGPNGCGKSNIVEALRWAMGESSARSLRGGEMDDVIFAGTTARSGRNLAEVSITLQRGAAALPEPFAAEEELQVSRRIERGAGSTYRANGREMRARDVQTLFADLASGARSSAMVSQGRVAALVQASPEDRRAVLEEAAGITGLHARRHEAELKLRAAETNCARAEELRTQLDTGREGLRRQARQAARYRNISGLVRAADAECLAVLRARAQLACAEEAAAQSAADAAAMSAALAAQAADIELRQAEAALPAHRHAEAEARQTLQRRRVEAESQAIESTRAQAALDEAQARLGVIRGDLADACCLEEDLRQALARLAASAEALHARLNTLPAEIAAAQLCVAETAAQVRAAGEAADAAATRAAEAIAASAQATQAVDQAEARAAEAARALDAAQAAHDAALAATISPDRLAAAECLADGATRAGEAARLEAAAAEQAAMRAAAAAAQSDRELTREGERAGQAGRSLEEAAARLARLDAAIAALAREIEAAQAGHIAPEALQDARAAETRARVVVQAAEHAASDAERAHEEANATCLGALAQRDQNRVRRAQLRAALEDAQRRGERLRLDADAWRAELVEQHAARPEAAQRQAAEAALGQARAVVVDAQTAWLAGTARREAADAALNVARAQAAAASAERARLAAEEDGTRHAASDGRDDAGGASVLGSIDVPIGLETAIGAVLADAADRLDEPGAMRFWRELPALAQAPPPLGCTSLAALVRAPAALGRALSYAALLGDGADGAALQPGLAPGWVVVSSQGDLWRWDGQVCRAGAPNAAATRLRLLARLREIRDALGKAGEHEAQALAAAKAAEAEATRGRAAETQAQAACQAAQTALDERARVLETLAARQAAADARIGVVGPALARLEAEAGGVATILAEADAAMLALPAAEDAEAALAAAQARAAEAAAAREASRRAREAARHVLDEAVAALRALQDRAARMQSLIAGFLPQRERLAAERADAAVNHADAVAACEALPDLAGLQAAARAAAGAAQAEAEALEAARRLLPLRERDLAEAAKGCASLHRQDAEARLALARADQALELAQAARVREVAALEACRAARAGLPDAGALAACAAQARQALAEGRAREAALDLQKAALAASLAEAEAAYPAVEQERAAWLTRQIEAARRHTMLVQREAEAAQECARWAGAPLALGARAVALDAAEREAEAAHAEAARALRAAETGASEAARSQRQAEAAQFGCREAQARGEGRAEAAQAGLRAVLARVAERLGPEASLPEVTLAGDGAAEEERARRRQERLARERDEMGPVNLRADIELDEIEARIACIDADREELATAIAKLRGSIGHLNREGRERLREVFAQVNAHFRTLFTRMMGGGRAHLALVGSDDPLEAGLEIFAEPPGKKLSALSLLSGGEQALTALSLIFAVFACTPAPLAVLDEVDAPLDDVNVDRFCGLLEDVVRETGTRFLVVTHHQLTMSRMDRLYGVTMQERGVSRVLSVDLQRAAAMVEPVLQAAE